MEYTERQWKQAVDSLKDRLEYKQSKNNKQQALIDELVEVCGKAQKWFDERNIHTAIQLQLDLEEALAKAEQGRKEGE